MEYIFSVIIEMSIKASIAIVAVLLARFFLRKAPRRFSYILWSAVGFRLCIPESYKVNLAFLFPDRQQSIIDSLKNVTSGTSDSILGSNTTAGAVQNTTIGAVGAVGGASEFDWMGFISGAAIAVWLIGVSIMITYGIISYIKIHRQMRNAILDSGRIYYSDKISAPFTLGFIRPRIYLPFGLSETEKKCIIAHEKCHIKRLDHITKLFAYILLSVHWFNPLCWIAFNRMSLDMEMSCDEIIFRKENSSEMKKIYTKTLVSIASKKRFPAPTPITFDDGRSTKKRVTNILNLKKPKLWINIICYALCLFILVACSADAESINESLGSEVFDEQPYKFSFQSDGNGNCSISEIYIDPDHKGDIHLIIPDKSPDGETVTSITSRGFSAEPLKNVPCYLTHSQYEDISKLVLESRDERDAKIFRSFYQMNVKNNAKYYVLEPYIAYDEAERLSVILKASGYLYEDRYSDTKDFLYRIPENEEKLKTFEANAYRYIYKNGTNITEVTVPKSLEFIETSAFSGCTKLKAVYGIPDGCRIESKEILDIIG